MPAPLCSLVYTKAECVYWTGTQEASRPENVAQMVLVQGICGGPIMMVEKTAKAETKNKSLRAEREAGNEVLSSITDKTEHERPGSTRHDPT